MIPTSAPPAPDPLPARYVPTRLRDASSLVLQALLTAIVVSWVLSLPQSLGINL
jgi:hypothetical protein